MNWFIKKTETEKEIIACKSSLDSLMKNVLHYQNKKDQLKRKLVFLKNILPGNVSENEEIESEMEHIKAEIEICDNQINYYIKRKREIKRDLAFYEFEREYEKKNKGIK